MHRATVIVRVDGSRRIGTGHVMRCFALARAWRARGGRVIFAAKPMPDALTERVRGGGIEIADIDPAATAEAELKQLAALVEAERADWLVVDGYGFDQAYVFALSKLGPPLLMLDDLADFTHFPCDLLLNQNIHAEPALYADKLRGEALLGPEFSLIRDDLRARADDNRIHPAVGSKLLALIGGADPEGFTVLLADAAGRAQTLLAGKTQLECRLIVGAANTNAEALREAAPSGVTVHRDVRDMAAMFTWCDMALSASGSTVWEMSLFGVPMILGAQNGGEAMLADRLQARGGCRYLGWFHDINAEQAARAIVDLAVDPTAREALSSTVTALVDGRGADRVVARMHALSTRRTG